VRPIRQPHPRTPPVYQPPPVEQARSITFSRMVRTMDAMMLNMHPVVRTCIAMRGSVAHVDQDREPIPGQQPCLGPGLTAIALIPRYWTNILPNIYLWGIWPASPSDWFIVGDGGHILRGQKGSWQIMNSGTTANLRRVWGSSATDVYAAGENGVLLHFDGTAWSPVSLPVSMDMWGVWGTSASDVWVTGDAGKLLHFDGTSWTVTQLPTPYKLYGVWGTSTNNVFVGGAGGYIFRWNGSRWIYEDSTTNAQVIG
jgi:hypothetical protein